MAGDWIKFELATLDKPEVLKMAEILGVSSDDVVGKLLRVWGWFDQQSRDGYAGGVTGNALMRFIDRMVAREGFARTMQSVGWLNEDGIPNFDRHNGKPAKDRALTKDRMKKKRDADVTLDASLEKRREELKPAEPSGSSPSGPVFGEGLQTLIAAGTSEREARRFLGMLLASWDEADVVSALASAIGKADPKAYAKKLLEGKPKKARMPPGADKVLADLRREYGAGVTLRKDAAGFWDPGSGRVWSLDGERRAAA